MKVLFANHDVTTERCGQFLDITDDVGDLVVQSGVRQGMALVFSPHTTCSVLINEREQGFIDDFNGLLDRLAPSAASYAHDDLEARTENLDDPHEIPNGHAHCRGALVGSSSEAVPIVDGRLLLGRWQRIFLLELDRSRDRKVLIQVMGE